MEALWNFLTAGHLVYLRPCPAAGHIATAILLISKQTSGDWSNKVYTEVTIQWMVYRSGFWASTCCRSSADLLLVCFSSAVLTSRRVFKLNICSRLKRDSADDKLVCSWSVFVKADLLQICSFRTGNAAEKKNTKQQQKPLTKKEELLNAGVHSNKKRTHIMSTQHAWEELSHEMGSVCSPCFLRVVAHS